MKTNSLFLDSTQGIILLTIWYGNL